MATESTGVDAPEHHYDAHRVSPEICSIMEVVCAQMDISVLALRGTSQNVRLVRARSIVAALSAELYPSLAAALVDETMLRGSGWCIWSRSRHADRCSQIPSYGYVFDRCRTAAIQALSK